MRCAATSPFGSTVYTDGSCLEIEIETIITNDLLFEDSGAALLLMSAVLNGDLVTIAGMIKFLRNRLVMISSKH